MRRRFAERGSVAVETVLGLLLLLSLAIGSTDLAFGLWMRSGLRFSTIGFARRASIEDLGAVRNFTDKCSIIEGILESRAAEYHKQQLAASSSPTFEIDLQYSVPTNSWYLYVSAQQEPPCFLCKLANLHFNIHGSSLERIESQEFNCV